MAHKTKAATNGRQSHHTKHPQNTWLAAGGQSLGAPEITGTAPLTRLGGMPGVGPTPFGSADFSVYLPGAAMAYTPQTFGSSLAFLRCSSLRSLRYDSRANFIGFFGEIVFVSGDAGFFAICQPFGSMPCRRNSSRASSFNQLPKLTPLRSAASLSCWRNSGLMRIWNVGDHPSPFGVLSRLIVDTYVHNLLTWILLCTYVITAGIKKATPRTGGTEPRRLTTNVSESNEAAMKDHITPPQGRKSYIWRFLALSAIGRNVIHITATTESEAREQSPNGCVMVFAGRLPVQEVRHA